MELRWRWKGMGKPEKVFTGKSYPFRRYRWRFRLIDGTVVEGSTKGQPVWVEFRRKRAGPFVLHERDKGPDDATLKDLLYVKKVVVSRRMMEAVIEDVEKQKRSEFSRSLTPYSLTQVPLSGRKNGRGLDKARPAPE